MDDDAKKLYIKLINAGKFEQAKSLQSAYDPAMGQRTTGSLGERGELLARGKKLGMTREDLFVPEESNASKFVADMGYGFQQQGLGIQQLAEHVMPGRNTENIDERVRQSQAEYQETGLADEITGGQVAANVIPALAGGILARGATAAMPLRTAMGLGAAEEAVQPVADNNFWTEKGKQVGFGATIGALTEIPTGAVRIMEEARNLPGRVVNKLSEPSGRPGGGMFRGDTGEMVGEVAEETGIDFTPAQVSGSPALGQVEELARTGLFTRNKVAAADASRAAQYENYIKGFRDSLGEGAPIEVVAPKIQAWGREQANEMLAYRRTQADTDYRPVQQYADGQPVIPATSYRDELELIINQGNGAGASSDQIRAAKQANVRLERLEDQGGYLTGGDVDQLTRASGEFSGGAFDVKNMSFDEQLNARVSESVMMDAQSVPGLKGYLDNAKANYARNSAHIDEFENGLVGQIMGKSFKSEVDGLISNTVSPEAVFKKFQSSSPTQITAALKHMNKNAPELGNQFRASIIDRAREAASFRPAAGGLDQTLDPGTFLRNMGVTSGGERGIQGWERLNALFPDNPEAVTALYRAGLILGDKTMANTSKTAVTTASRDAIDAAMGLISGSIRKLTGTIGSAAGLNQVANAMQTGAQAGVQPVVMGSTRRVIGGGRIPIRVAAGSANNVQGEQN